MNNFILQMIQSPILKVFNQQAQTIVLKYFNSSTSLQELGEIRHHIILNFPVFWVNFLCWDWEFCNENSTEQSKMADFWLHLGKPVLASVIRSTISELTEWGASMNDIQQNEETELCCMVYKGSCKISPPKKITETQKRRPDPNEGVQKAVMLHLYKLYLQSQCLQQDGRENLLYCLLQFHAMIGA